MSKSIMYISDGSVCCMFVRIEDNFYKYIRDKIEMVDDSDYDTYYSLRDIIANDLTENHSDLVGLVMSHGGFLKYITNQTEEICLAAVKQNGLTLQYVKNQTPEICLAAVKQNGYALYYVENQTEEICLAAVKQNGYALKFVISQTSVICLAAVKQKGFAIGYVENQTEEICLASIIGGMTLLHIKEKTLQLCLVAIEKSKYPIICFKHDSFEPYVHYYTKPSVMVNINTDKNAKKVAIITGLVS